MHGFCLADRPLQRSARRAASASRLGRRYGDTERYLSARRLHFVSFKEFQLPGRARECGRNSKHAGSQLFAAAVSRTTVICFLGRLRYNCVEARVGGRRFARRCSGVWLASTWSRHASAALLRKKPELDICWRRSQRRASIRHRSSVLQTSPFDKSQH